MEVHNVLIELKKMTAEFSRDGEPAHARAFRARVPSDVPGRAAISVSVILSPFYQVGQRLRISRAFLNNRVVRNGNDGKTAFYLTLDVPESAGVEICTERR